MKLPPSPTEHHSSSNRLPTTIVANKRDPSVKQYRRERSNRHVTFEVDENNQIRALSAPAASPSTRCATAEEVKNLWWDRQELKQIWKREKAICDFYKKSDDDYSDQIWNILGRCSDASSDHELADAQWLAARSSNRGLEQGIVTILHAHRKKTIQSIVKHYQSPKLSQLSDKSRNHMLRSKSTSLSRPARAFAKLVGTADELIAAAAHQVPSEQSQSDLSLPSLMADGESFNSATADHWRWGASFRKEDSIRRKSSSRVRS